MTALQHRAHIADRVQRLEAWAFTTGADMADIEADVADIEAALEQLPAVIREEVLAYTEPVFGEIMAGRATLATKEDLERLTELMEKRFGSVDAEFRSINARFESVDGRFESVDAKLQSLDTKLDQVLAALGKTNG